MGQTDSPAWGLQNPSKIAGQFGRNHKNPKARVSLAAVGFSGLIPSTTGHDFYNNRSGKEEKGERERLRVVEGHGVTGKTKSLTVNSNCEEEPDFSCNIFLHDEI
jgi:hypothetical protein